MGGQIRCPHHIQTTGDKDMEDKNVKMDTVSISDTDTNKKNCDTTTTDNKNSPSDFEAAQINELTTQVNELNDKYLRAVAELENTRRRAALDAESRARNRAISVAEKILPVMDAVQVALTHAPNDEGIKSMALALESAFAQIGISKIESVGQVMNPQFHNAIQVVDVPKNDDKRPAPNTIIDEMQSGYMFGDTVLRTAIVTVCK